MLGLGRGEWFTAFAVAVLAVVSRREGVLKQRVASTKGEPQRRVRAVGDVLRDEGE